VASKKHQIRRILPVGGYQTSKNELNGPSHSKGLLPRSMMIQVCCVKSMYEEMPGEENQNGEEKYWKDGLNEGEWVQA